MYFYIYQGFKDETNNNCVISNHQEVIMHRPINSIKFIGLCYHVSLIFLFVGDKQCAHFLISQKIVIRFLGSEF